MPFVLQEGEKTTLLVLPEDIKLPADMSLAFPNTVGEFEILLREDEIGFDFRLLDPDTGVATSTVSTLEDEQISMERLIGLSARERRYLPAATLWEAHRRADGAEIIEEAVREMAAEILQKDYRVVTLMFSGWAGTDGNQLRLMLAISCRLQTVHRFHLFLPREEALKVLAIPQDRAA